MKANFQWVNCKNCNYVVGAGSFKPLTPNDLRILRARCKNCQSILKVNLEGIYLSN